MHMMFGAGALLLVVALVVLLILILTASVVAPSAVQLGGIDAASVVILLLLAILVPAAFGALLAGWPLRLPIRRLWRSAVQPEDLADAELRREFERMIEYRQGIAEAARAVGDRQLRHLLHDLLKASDEPLRMLFWLAREVSDNRQNRLLPSDLARLRSQTESLSAAEREQLASLERLDEMTRLSSRLIGDTQAILGRCYAQGREAALAHNLASGETQYLMEQLRDQAALLGHVTEAVREVYGGRK